VAALVEVQEPLACVPLLLVLWVVMPLSALPALGMLQVLLVV
jgi:hypothetical protein